MSINYRYELKYVYSRDDYWRIIDIILLHPYMFKEIYNSRKVCNIYLDSIELKNYYDNLNGVKNRTKNRVRWYDDDSCSPILEYKNKVEKLGWKNSYVLCSLDLNNFSWSNYLINIDLFLKNSPRRYEIIRDLESQEPVLNNTYIRKYFMSIDGKFRITVDKDLKYRRIDNHGIGQSFHYDPRTIVEIKFSKDDFSQANQITKVFKNSISSNSKYVTGINSIYFNKSIPWENIF